MSHRTDRDTPGALELAEQAVRLLRQRGGTALACYYIGVLPFLLGLLYFWSDMSRDPDAAGYGAPAAAGMAILFIWMKLWQVRFCRTLWCVLQGTPPEPWSWRRTWVTAARQAALQATGTVVLPLASVILVPMAWAYAFYQNLSVMDGPDTGGLKDLYRKAADQALLWPGSNHLLLTLISAFGLFVFANVVVGMMMLPYLLKWFLGIETTFTTGGLHAVVNTTFLAATCAATYLCLDPIVKAAYTLRCFYGRSRRTGDDLRAAIQPLIIAVLLIALVVGGATGRSWAAPSGASARPERSSAPPGQEAMAKWNRAMDQILSQRRFAWRMPREKHVKARGERRGWFWSSLHWLKKKIETAFEAVDAWLDALSRWLRKIFPQGQKTEAAGTDWSAVTRIVFYLIGAGLLISLLLSIRNRLRHGRILHGTEKSGAAETVIDLNDENLTADDLPREKWLALAREMMARRELRQALRAFYLSLLAQLGDQGRIVIARYKSNRDYRGELGRRSHSEPELVALFDRCVAAFERAWYGMHPVAEDQLSLFVSDQERICLLVQPSTLH